MRKRVSCLLLMALLIILLPVTVAVANADADIPPSGDGVFLLPAYITKIEDEAFMGNAALSTLVIPNTIEEIGSKAFSNCTNLTEVFFGNSSSVKIAKDAFDNKENLIFYVWPETPAELYAYSHGLNCEIVTTGSSIYERAMGLVANHGGSVTWQSGDFAAQRLIIKRSNGKLPDISEFNPSEIVRDGDIYIVQFDSETLDNVQECYASLINAPGTEWIETDKYNSIATYDEVSAAGVVDESYWDTNDPMGFEVYAPFVKDHSSEGITIAVLDTGIKRNARYNNKLREDGINMLARYDQQDWTADFANHGSYIAGIIADCVGDANVSILPIRILTAKKNYQDEEETFSTTVGLGIKYAVEHGAKIINISQNFKESAYVTEKINEAINKHVMVVVSAGNNRRPISAATFPANLPGVITVAGLDRDYLLSANTNYGNNVSYCAPDTKVTTSAYPGWTMPGTSFSAPMVASALALVEIDTQHTIADLDATCYINPAVSDGLTSYGKGMPRVNLLANIPVTSITLSEDIKSVIGIGKKDTKLTWTVLPENATNKTITVTSSAPTVLSVVTDEDGNTYARGLKVGSATLTFTAASGVSVSKPFTIVQPVESIEIVGGKSELAVGRTMQLNVVVSPENATNKEVQWSKMGWGTVTVSATGLVTAIESEDNLPAYIIAKAKDGFGANAMISVKIVDKPDAESVLLTVAGQNVNDISLKPGATAQLVAKVTPDDADQNVSFVSSNETIASVSTSGLVTAKSSGTAKITVTSADGKASAELDVTVLVMPTSVSISGPSAVNQGSTISLTASVAPNNAYDRTVTWQSDNPSIARVDSSTGVVTGVSGGKTTIRAYANGDQNKYGTKEVTVRASFTLSFDVNAKIADGSTDTSAIASYSSKTVYNGDTIGSLPTATRDYYAFNGWWTAANGGTPISENSVANTSVNKLYAHWTLNAESDWVLPSEVPADAMITDTSYSYRESCEDTNAGLEGWVANGEYWKKDSQGYKYYASFPSGFDTGHTLYQSYMKGPYQASETATTKREVENVQDGWIYWHWMYKTYYASGTERRISSRQGYFDAYGNTTGDSAYGYNYFYAMASDIDCPYLGTGYCCSQNVPSYNAKQVVDQLASNADKNSNESGLGTDRFFRFERYKCYFTDYLKTYKYYRDVSFQHDDPGDGENITNKVTYVKYRMKYGSISDWSETKPEGVDENLIQTKTQYRHSDKETTTGTSSSMNGWTLYDTQQVWGDYGPWSNWSSTAISASESTRVETRTGYGWYYFECPNCHAHMHGYGTCWTWCGGCGAKTTSDSWHVMYDGTNWNAAQDWYGTGKYYAIIDGERWFRWDDGGTETQYRSSTRTQSTIYSFYRWSDWSPWGDTVYTASDNTRVETRTLYRYVIS